MQNLQIAEIIKSLCKENQITIKELLEKCDINRNFMYDLEKRDSSPSSDKIVKIANYFNISTDYLLCRTSNPINPNLVTKE